MADNDPINDDYQFTEMDPLNPSSYSDASQAEPSEKSKTTSKLSSFVGDRSVKQKAIIVVVIFIVLSLGYKFFGAFLGSKNSNFQDIETKPPVPTEPVKPTPKPVLAPENLIPKENTEHLNNTVQNQDVVKKVNELNVSQEMVRNEMTTLGNQISNINNNMQELTKKIGDMTVTLTAMNDKLNLMSQEIVKVQTKPKIEKVVKYQRPHPYVAIAAVKYYIQAVIPGRAWLVTKSGNTMTVREGSSVPNYGRVTLIDPNQGRVLTTSGRVIKFSQEES